MAEEQHAETIQFMERYCMQRGQEAQDKGDKKSAENWFKKAEAYGRWNSVPRKKLKKKE